MEFCLSIHSLYNADKFPPVEQFVQTIWYLCGSQESDSYKNYLFYKPECVHNRRKSPARAGNRGEGLSKLLPGAGGLWAAKPEDQGARE